MCGCFPKHFGQGPIRANGGIKDEIQSPQRLLSCDLRRGALPGVSRPLKKPASGVLASLRSSPYDRGTIRCLACCGLAGRSF
jgi:hypothetical protein